VTEEAWEGSAAPVHFSMGIKFGLGPGESRHCVKCCSDIFVLKKDTVQKRETQKLFRNFRAFCFTPETRAEGKTLTSAAEINDAGFDGRGP